MRGSFGFVVIIVMVYFSFLRRSFGEEVMFLFSFVLGVISRGCFWGIFRVYDF